MPFVFNMNLKPDIAVVLFHYRNIFNAIVSVAVFIISVFAASENISAYFSNNTVTVPAANICLALASFEHPDVLISGADIDDSKFLHIVNHNILLPSIPPTPKPTQPPQTLNPAPIQPQPLPPSDYDHLMEEYGNLYGVNPEVMKKIARCESGFNPGAVNGPYGGMFQFLTSTWISNRNAMGLDPDPSLRFNAEEAIKTAAFKMGRDGTGAWPVCSR
jgi:hypothetical protein